MIAAPISISYTHTVHAILYSVLLLMLGSLLLLLVVAVNMRLSILYHSYSHSHSEEHIITINDFLKCKCHLNAERFYC